LGISKDTLMNEVNAGRLIAFKIGGTWRFDKRDLDAYVDALRDGAALAARKIAQRKESSSKIVHLRKPTANAGQVIDRVWTPGKKIENVCAKTKGPFAQNNS